MAQEKPRSPERELLDLIEEDKSSSTKALSRERKTGGFFSFGAIRGRVSFLLSAVRQFLHPRRISIPVVNGFLAAALVSLLVYVIIEVSLSVMHLNSDLEAAFIVEEPAPMPKLKEISLLKEEEYYLKEAKKRDIFNLITREDEKKADKKPKIKEVVKKTEHLKLVGISWGETPDAMVEDTRAKKTFFVKKGDMIGVVKVDDILMEKIVLSYQGEKVELE